MGVNKRARVLDHEVGKEPAVRLDFLAVAPGVMSIGTILVKEVGPVIDAASHVAEGIAEPLARGHGVRRVAQVPLSDVRSSIGLPPSSFRPW